MSGALKDGFKNYMTPGGYRRLHEELARLWKVERPALGLQDRRLGETLLFVLPSTSPANAAVPWEERLRWFRELSRASGW